jgi:polysaccharide export outer membrane protein
MGRSLVGKQVSSRVTSPKDYLLRVVVVVCIGILTVSCASKKQVYYLQDSEDYVEQAIAYTSPTLQPNDIVRITVGSIEPEAAVAYNRSAATNSANPGNLDILKLDGYLVSSDFKIDFPVLGEISVKDKTTSELEDTITVLLEEGGHLTDPKVNVRLVNSKFTVLGEVNNPGTFTFTEEQVSVLQALGYAGDLSVYGRRDEIVLIRELDGDRKITHLDLTSSKLLESPFYYLKPNDVIVVKQNYAKVKSAGFVGNTGTIVAIASLLISLTVLLTN